MKPTDLRGAIAIAGVGQAGCGEAHGYTEMEILAQSARQAVEDAGLKMSDIDGLMTASVNSTMWGLSVGEYLGIRPSFTDNTMIGGSSFVAHLQQAALAIQAGICSAVLVCYGSTQRTGMGRATLGKLRAQMDPLPFETPYAPFNPPTSYAFAARRHMHEFGTTREQLAEVAVAARAWARLNPEAFARDPLSIEDVLGARMISDPLTVRDCCLVTDGAGAYVVVSAERAHSLKQKPVYVLGTGVAHYHRQIASMPELTVSAAADSGKRAYEMAGLSARDIDVVELYDAFTINTILFLEDLGFCAKGEGGAFVANGNIAPGGKLPVNTNGGGLSCVHPGMYGMFITIEAVRQLRGEAGERQVQGAQTALVHGNGGVLSSQATTVLGLDSTL